MMATPSLLPSCRELCETAYLDVINLPAAHGHATVSKVVAAALRRALHIRTDARKVQLRAFGNGEFFTARYDVTGTAVQTDHRRNVQVPLRLHGLGRGVVERRVMLIRNSPGHAC